jgi:hypothetical protein
MFSLQYSSFSKTLFKTTLLIGYRNIELKEHLVQVIQIRLEEAPRPEAGTKSAQKWNRQLSKHEWKLSKQLLDVLKPLQVATVALQSNDTPTISTVIPYVSTIIKDCEDIRDNSEEYAPIIRRVAKSIVVGIKRRFSSVLDNSLYAIATLVDPTTKHYFLRVVPDHAQEIVTKFVLDKIKDSTEVEDTDNSKKTKAVPSNDQPVHSFLDSRWNLCSSANTETASFDLTSYINEPCTQGVSHFMKRQPKALQELYTTICGIPATSSEVERLFSACGLVNSKLRCAMTSENVEKRCLLKKNSKVLSTFNMQSAYPKSTPKITNWTTLLPKFKRSYFPDDNEEEQSKEESELQESLVNSESSGEDEDEIIPPEELQSPGYWHKSSKPKCFWNGVRVFNQQQKDSDNGPVRRSKRKRGDEDDEGEERKRRRTLLPCLVTPKVENRVSIHFTNDCECKKPIVECTCDLWYDGTITSICETNVEGERLFAVYFDCGEEEEHAWKIAGPNIDWAFLK